MDVVTEVCVIAMSDDKACGRPIHNASTGFDKQPVCLMHSYDPTKSSAAFNAEIGAILSPDSRGQSSASVSDFTSFVFSNYDVTRMTFTKDAVFRRATFTKGVGFIGATFTEHADFNEATFTEHADFNGATFTKGVDFNEATFTEHADFNGATFTKDARFNGTTFTKDARFNGATFTKDAHFNEATFAKDARFDGATFAKGVDFMGATFAEHVKFSMVTFTENAHFSVAIFAKEADFSGARFPEHAYFRKATFTEKAYFNGATFTEHAEFSGATFAEPADFSGATFTKGANFYRATFNERSFFKRTVFLDAVHFDDTRFGAMDGLVGAIADFRGASFVKPELVRFLRTNKKAISGLHVRFVNCRMEGVQLEAVRWYRSNNRIVLQDELDILERSEDPPSYEEVATAYRRLITNFENARAYDLSDDCTIGEFEMKRRNPDQFIFAEWLNPIYENYPRLRNCIGEQLSIVGIYRLASMYGTSYQRALIALGALLLAFGLCYSAIAEIRLVNLPIDGFLTCNHANRLNALCSGVLHSIEIATLQRRTLYEPVSAFGFIIEILEQILIAGQAALLLFALRRRFRR